MQRMVGYTGTEIDASEYPVCGEKYQSPVDIKVKSTEFASAYAGLKFKNYDKAPEFKLINTGHTGSCLCSGVER